MKKNATSWLIIGAILVLVVASIYYFGKPEKPAIEQDGSINGNYSLESIMTVGQPYRCAFSKSDQTTIVAGTVFTDGEDAFGEFRILTDLTESEFNGYLLVKKGRAYTWTSLSNAGYESRAASSASRNAAPEQQAQIIGKKDKLDYDCKPWEGADKTVFEVPGWVSFVKI